MPQSVVIEIDGQRIEAFAGDRLLDALLLGGLEFPGDCRAGQCGACVVRLLAGELAGGEAREPGCYHACQTIVHTSLRLTRLSQPPAEAGPTTAQAVVAAVDDLTQDVVEITLAVAPATPFPWRPGQFARVTFEGFPSRPFSPTTALDGRDRPGTFRLHVKRVEGGHVTGAVGRSIRPGHRVGLAGPFGRGALTPGGGEPLVLFSSSTGFAPIWAIADAALRENRARRMVVVAAVASLENLYMPIALERMSSCPNVVILPATAAPQRYTPLIRTGTLPDFANLIGTGDHVCAAGPQSDIQALAAYARKAGAVFQAIPFEPAEAAEDRWLGQIARQFAAPLAPPMDGLTGR